MKAQRLSLDGISTLPRNIIETILCLLPIQEAARTSILSREWRYTWTKIPKLVFHRNTFEISTDMSQPSILEQTSDSPDQGQWVIMRFNLLYAINQVLLLRQGPILEFTLFMYADDTCLEIDQIILHLLRNNTIRKLSLLFDQFNNPRHGEYRLPLSIFSLHQLTHLYLRCCYLDHQPTFNGFGSLTTLSLKNVYISSKSLLHLLSNCPLLKTVSLFLHEGNILGNDNFTYTELFERLPVLEKLSMWHRLVECFAQDRVPQVLPITLIHLKHFIIKDFYFTDEYGLRLLGLVMRSSPKLENLTLMMYEYPSYEETGPDLVKDYSHIWLEHLKECKIRYFANFKHEMEFVKLILAKSPVLKKVSIWLHDDVTEDEELTISRILSNSPRASSVAEVVVER